MTSLFSTFAPPAAAAQSASTARARDLSVSAVIGSFQLPNLPREEKLSYIESQKRKLVEYIKYLDDAAAAQHNEDLRHPTSSSRGMPSPPPSATQDQRRWSGGSTSAPLAAQFDDGFEAVDRNDLPSGSVIASASGVKGNDDVTRRGWFSGWGGATQQQ
jgi:hypothetical protein